MAGHIMHTIMADIVKVMIAGFVFGVTILKASLIASLSAISISRITAIGHMIGISLKARANISLLMPPLSIAIL